MDAHDGSRSKSFPRLVLEIADQVIEFSSESDDERLCLGRDTVNHLVLSNDATSRRHAYIQFKNNDFFVVDESTNGTYVQTEDQLVTKVHRDTLRLWGCGWISLGAPVNHGQPVYFRQLSGS
ncbi:MAG: FHA domain-containing protein [Pseudomonadota bacterium]